MLVKNLTKEQKEMLYELSVILYDTKRKGREACEKLAELFDLESAYCPDCEENIPVLDGVCFVCGSLIHTTLEDD